MTTRSILNALTGAILRGQMDVETARSLVIRASSDQQTEVEEQLSLNPTATKAAKALGISRATLYRRLAAKAGS
jgi:transcriptional regulator of acetoin/glycerol metabolism